MRSVSSRSSSVPAPYVKSVCGAVTLTGRFVAGLRRVILKISVDGDHVRVVPVHKHLNIKEGRGEIQPLISNPTIVHVWLTAISMSISHREVVNGTLRPESSPVASRSWRCALVRRISARGSGLIPRVRTVCPPCSCSISMDVIECSSDLRARFTWRSVTSSNVLGREMSPLHPWA